MSLFKVGVLFVSILSIQQVQSYKLILIDGNKLYISCSGFDRIEIQSAKWQLKHGVGMGNLNRVEQRKYSGLNADETNSIRKHCNNKAVCQKVRQSSGISLAKYLEFHIIYDCYPGSCPNQAFIAKHVVPAGVSPVIFAGLAEQNRINKEWQQVSAMTVFTNAAVMTYSRNPRDKTQCEFNSAVQKHECRKQDSSWICNPIVGTYIARHRTTSGHYLP